jgi:hypothetical protein
VEEEKDGESAQDEQEEQEEQPIISVKDDKTLLHY